MFRDPFGRYGVRPPWQEMEKLQREMNRLFTGVYGEPAMRPPVSYPAIDVWTSENGAVVTAELPGADPADIDISVVGDTLTLNGSRKPDALQEGEKYHRRERGFGNFVRTFQLPFQVEADKVEAMFDRGVLHISLPRAEADKPRKIAIKAA